MARVGFKTAKVANSPVEWMRIATTGQITMNTSHVGGDVNIGTTNASNGLRIINATANGTGSGVCVTSNYSPCLYAVNDNGGNAVKVQHNGTDGSGAGILVQSKTAVGINATNSTSGTAIYASTASGNGIVSYGTLDGIYASATPSGGWGGEFHGGSIGAYGSGPTGFYESGSDTGVIGTTSGSYGVYGSNQSSANYGVYGYGGQYAVAGNGGSTAAVRGDNNYVGGYFVGGSWGLYSKCSASSGGYGIMGENPNSDGYAIYSKGNMAVQGTLSKSAGSFKIDHPLDPINKWLSHSFVESPDMMNIYNGVVTLAGDGTATVTLPNYFTTLNKDYRYQLTCVGGYADVYIASEVSGGSFKIAGGKSGLKVSWQVTGIRQDDYAKAHPIVVEQVKTRDEKGTRSFVPKGSSAKAMASGPNAPAVKAEAPPKGAENRAAPAKPKPAMGQNWTPSKL